VFDGAHALGLQHKDAHRSKVRGVVTRLSSKCKMCIHAEWLGNGLSGLCRFKLMDNLVPGFIQVVAC
jgi:hypothetical protein